MNIKNFILLAGMTLVILSCELFTIEEDEKKPVTPAPYEDIPIEMSVDLGSLDSKAENYDDLTTGSFGLYYSIDGLTSPKYNAENRKVRYIDEAWSITGDSLFYKPGMTARFFAYYPYEKNVDISGTEFEWFVPTNQTSAKYLKNADLLYSHDEILKSEKMDIYFEHLMTKLRIRISVSDRIGSSYSIKDVILKNSITGCIIDLTSASISHIEYETSPIEMFQEEDNRFSCIIIPQNLAYKLEVIMDVDGHEMTFSYKSNTKVTFKGGCEYTIPIEITEHDASASAQPAPRTI